MRSELSEVIEHAEVVIVGKKEEEYLSVSEKLGDGRVVIDLIGLLKDRNGRSSYQGICW